MSHYFLMRVLVFLAFTLVQAFETLKICKENEDCELSYNWQPTTEDKVTFIWKMNGTQVGTCNRQNGNSSCAIYPIFNNVSILNIKNNGPKIALNITIPKVSLSQSNSIWELSAYYRNTSEVQIYNCTLKIYREITQYQCQFETNNDGLRLKCSGSNLYPESVCEFSVHLNNQTFYSATPSKHEHDFRNKSFVTSCSATILKNDLRPGTYVFDISMYPNVSVSEIDKKQLKKKDSKSIIFDFPKVTLIGCPEFVNYDETTYCICKTSDNSEIKTTVSWETDIISKKNDFAVLEYTVRNKAIKGQEYTCNGTNIFGHLTQALYTPLFREKCSQVAPHYCSTKCFNDSQFCDKGIIKNCFPANALENDRQNACLNHSKNDNTCFRACWNTKQLSSVKGPYYSWEIPFLTSNGIFTFVVVLLVIIVAVLAIKCRQQSGNNQPLSSSKEHQPFLRPEANGNDFTLNEIPDSNTDNHRADAGSPKPTLICKNEFIAKLLSIMDSRKEGAGSSISVLVSNAESLNNEGRFLKFEIEGTFWRVKCDKNNVDH